MSKPILYSSLFGELTKNVQVRFDAISRMNKQVFDKVIYRDYLDWETPSIGLDFESIIGKYNLTIAAATVGLDAKEPIVDPNGLETFKNTVLKHAQTRPLSVKDYRKILQLLDSKTIPEESKRKQLVVDLNKLRITARVAHVVGIVIQAEGGAEKLRIRG